MKIAILTRDLPPQIGGTEIGSYYMAKFLAKMGHRVLVITTWNKGYPRISVMDGFIVCRLRFSRNKVLKFIGLILFSMKTVLVLRKFQPDVIHGQSIYMGVSALISSTICRKPYVLWLQGSDIYRPWLFQIPISKLVLSRAHCVLALTDHMRKEALKLSHREISIISSGVDLERFKGLSREEARLRLQLTQESKIITFIGRFRKIKGVNYLVEAMTLIRQACPDVHLFLIGDGTERQSLETLVRQLHLKQNITFTGIIPNERIAQYLRASDLFVLPSLSEGFPVTLLEAMVCGVPIITTCVAGLPEIIHDGENGFIVNPRSSTEIAEKALAILTNKTTQQIISQNNEERANYYSWENIAKKLEEVYAKLT